jgi:hypothetical protein
MNGEREMPVFRYALITSILLMQFVSNVGLSVAADENPGVLEYTFADVDPIRIYAGPVTFDHTGHVKGAIV